MSSNSERFCLKWKNHASNLTKSLIETVTEQCFVDVTLACEDGSLKAHKLVLSTCSLYFKELLKTNPCKHPIVIFKDMKMRDLKAIVDFMYKGEVNISHSQLSTLLKTAETLKVKGLTESTDGTQNDCNDPSREQFEEADRQSSDGGGAPPTQSTSVSAPQARRRKRRRTRRSTSIPEIPLQQEMHSSSDGEEVIDIIASIKKPVDSEEEASEASRAPQVLAITNEADELSQTASPRIPSPNIVQTRRRTQQSRSSTGETSAQRNGQNQQHQRSILRRNTNDTGFVSEDHTLVWTRNSQSLTDNEEQFDPTIDRSLAVYEEGGDTLTYTDDGSSEYMSLATTNQSSSSRVCACHLCHVTFTAYSSLRRHMQRHFADPERYECDICQNRYTRKDYLKRHKAQKHGIR